jgi:hypothetical protein
MVKIHCTAKLKDFLSPLIETDCLETGELWNAHLFYLERRKGICFLNKETLYAVVLFDILKKDLKNLKSLFVESLIQQLYSDGILAEENEPKVRAEFAEIHFCPTNNDRSAMGSLNDTLFRVKVSETLGEAKNYVSKYVNVTPMGAIKYQYPKDLMREKIMNCR